MRPSRRARRAAAAASAAALLGWPALADDALPATPREEVAPQGAGSRAGLGLLLQLEGESSAPLTIESDEVDLRANPDESRLLRFLRNVRVEQGAFRLRADELEAYYPPEESEPSRLVARGAVQIDQPGQRATCDEAEYVRETDRLVCRGHARLVQGCDEVRGEAIELALSGDRARVVGAARVVIAPREGGSPCAGAPGAPDGPP